MNDVGHMAANKGDTTVHYACGSGTLSLRNRLNAAKDAKSDVSAARSFQSEMHRKRGNCFLTLVRQNGKKIFEKEPLVMLCT